MPRTPEKRATPPAVGATPQGGAGTGLDAPSPDADDGLGIDAILDRLEDIAQHHDEDLCRESAVAALGSLGQQRSAPIVVRACSDRPTIRRRAVLALVAFDGPEVDKMLRELTKDTDWQVRQAAEELLSIE